MNVCKKCGNVVNDDVKFCPECGDNISAPVVSQSQYTAANNYQSQQYGVPEYEPIPVYNAPEEPQKPKKSKFKKFLSGFATFLAIVIFATIKVAVSDRKTEPDYSYNASNTVSFTTGEIIDGVYTNTWANIKYTIPEGYEQLDDSEVAYLTEGDAGENLGFYISGGGKYFALAFENYGPSLGYTDAKDYLESVYDEDYKSEYVKNGYTVEIGDVQTMHEAYREFFYTHVKISDGEEYFYQTFFVTEIQGRMTLLMAISPTATENEAMMIGLEAIN